MQRSALKEFLNRLPRFLQGENIEQRTADDREDDNPWLQFTTAPGRKLVAAKSQTSETGANAAPSRWLSEQFSPYGMAEDDGTMRQVDSQSWRRAFGTKPSGKRFVPSKGSASRPTPSASSTGIPTTFTERLVRQAVIGGLLVAGMYGLHHATSTQWRDVDARVSRWFSVDYTSSVMPFLDRTAEKFNVRLPGPVKHPLQPPTGGTIVSDYSTTHPELSISAAADSDIVSISQGTVASVKTADHLEKVTVNYGSYGTAIYDGLGSTDIKAGDTVEPGQVLGHMPAGTSAKTFTFSMMKDGSSENPHDLITFPQSSS